MNWSPLVLSLQLAAVTTVILFFVAIPISYGISRMNSWLKPLLEAFIGLPIVLPPTVLGFYLLVFLSPNSTVGSFLQDNLAIDLVFTFGGLVVASIIYSLPFMIHPIQSGLEKFPRSLVEASYTLGKTPWQTLFRVQLPNIKPALFTGIILTFAHTLGEFGLVLMIGGNIPGSTRVASIAIYDEVEALNYDMANTYSLILLATSFFLLLGTHMINRNSKTLILS